MADGEMPRPAHEFWAEEEQVVARMRARLAAWTPADGDFETFCAFLKENTAHLSPYWRDMLHAEIDTELAKHVIGDHRRPRTWRERLFRPRPNPRHSVDIWLQCATRGLGDEGCERIDREIYEHYRDAFDDAIKGDATPLDAHALAMDALGDPKAAHVALRKAYLTHWEVDFLEKVHKKNRKANERPAHAKVRVIAGLLFFGIWFPLAVYFGAHWIIIAGAAYMQGIVIAGAIARLLFAAAEKGTRRYQALYILREWGVIVWLSLPVFLFCLIENGADNEPKDFRSVLNFGFMALQSCIIILYPIAAWYGLEKILRKRGKGAA